MKEMKALLDMAAWLPITVSLEYQLKRRHTFLKADRFGNATVNWTEVKEQVDKFRPAALALRVGPVGSHLKRVRNNLFHGGKESQANSPSMATTMTAHGRCSRSWTEERSGHPIPKRLRVEQTPRTAPSVSRRRPLSQ